MARKQFARRWWGFIAGLNAALDINCNRMLWASEFEIIVN
jgi:hypothetical protein